MPVNAQFNTTFITSLLIERAGILSIQGWDRDFNTMPSLALRVDGKTINANEAHRIYRPDIGLNLNIQNSFLGFSIEFCIDHNLTNSSVEILLEGQPIWSQKINQIIISPHYGNFLTESTVKHRENIYGSGPPSKIISDEILDLVEPFIQYNDRVLDFGCGRGNLVQHLRKKGCDAYGIEIDSQIMREALLPEIRDKITLYQGDLPLPYADGEFDCVTAIEVIEHVQDYLSVLKEINRVSRKKFIMTVPDITAIPRCFPQSVVPWHLLEGTHVNFFTEKSLKNTLSPLWAKMMFLKIGHVQVNDTRYATSVSVYCEKN